MVVKEDDTEWLQISATPPTFQCFHLSPVTSKSLRKGHRIVTSASGEAKVARPVSAPKKENGKDLYSKQSTKVFVMQNMEPNRLCPTKPYFGYGHIFRNWRIEVPPEQDIMDAAGISVTKNVTNGGKSSTSKSKDSRRQSPNSELTDFGYPGGSPNHMFGLDSDPRPINYVIDFLWKTERGMKKSKVPKDQHAVVTSQEKAMTAGQTSKHLTIQMAEVLYTEPDDLVNGLLDHACKLHPGNDLKKVLHGFHEFESNSGATGFLKEIFGKYRPQKGEYEASPGDIEVTDGIPGESQRIQKDEVQSKCSVECEKVHVRDKTSQCDKDNVDDMPHGKESQQGIQQDKVQVVNSMDHENKESKILIPGTEYLSSLPTSHEEAMGESESKQAKEADKEATGRFLNEADKLAIKDVRGKIQMPKGGKEVADNVVVEEVALWFHSMVEKAILRHP